MPIHLEKQCWGQTLMLDEKALLAISVLVRPCPKVFDGVEVRVLCRPVKVFHTKLTQPWPCFMHWGSVMLEQKRAFPKLFPQSWKHRIYQHVLVGWSTASLTNGNGIEENSRIKRSVPILLFHIVYLHTHTHTHTHAHTHTRTHARTHAHTHTHTHFCLFNLTKQKSSGTKGIRGSTVSVMYKLLPQISPVSCEESLEMCHRKCAYVEYGNPAHCFEKEETQNSNILWCCFPWRYVTYLNNVLPTICPLGANIWLCKPVLIGGCQVCVISAKTIKVLLQVEVITCRLGRPIVHANILHL